MSVEWRRTTDITFDMPNRAVSASIVIREGGDPVNYPMLRLDEHDQAVILNSKENLDALADFLNDAGFGRHGLQD